MGVLRVWNGSGWDEIKGERGDTGASAYEIAVNEGFVGTEAEWLASLEVDPADIENAVDAAIDAEPRISQLVTDTEALTTSMAAVEPIAERVSTQRYDVRAFGPMGSGDAIQAAATATAAVGGCATSPHGSTPHRRTVR